MTFSLEYYYADYKVAVKVALYFAEVTLAPNLIEDVANQSARPKTNINPFEVMRQGKVNNWSNIPEDTTADQPVWSITVAES